MSGHTGSEGKTNNEQTTEKEADRKRGQEERQERKKDAFKLTRLNINHPEDQ